MFKSMDDGADAAALVCVFRQTRCIAAYSTALVALRWATGTETVLIGSFDAEHIIAASTCTHREKSCEREEGTRKACRSGRRSPQEYPRCDDRCLLYRQVQRVLTTKPGKATRAQVCVLTLSSEQTLFRMKIQKKHFQGPDDYCREFRI